MRRSVRILAVPIIASAGVAVVPGVAGAANTYHVTSTFDTGPGTLRQAVLDANANPGADVVTIDLPTSYVLNLTSSITSTDTLTVQFNHVPVTLEGPAAPIWTHTGGSTLTVHDADLVGTQSGVGGLHSDGPVVVATSTFTDLTGGAIVADGADVTTSTFIGNGADNGGAVWSTGDVTVDGSTFTDNTADVGGAINTSGSVHVTDATFAGNTSTAGLCSGGTCFGGGAIMASAAVIDDSSFTANTATASGGALAVSGPVTISDSAFTDNSGGGRGGGAIDQEGDGGATVNAMTISRSSFVGNEATGDSSGGAINQVMPTAVVTIDNSTFAQNSTADGSAAVGVYNGTVDLRFVTFLDNAPGTGNGLQAADVQASSLQSYGTVFAGTVVHCDVDNADSDGYNVEESTSSCELGATTDLQSSADPGLAPPADNGGITLSALPTIDSLLVNRIPASDLGCSGADQRGVVRPEGASCDVGAVEVAPTDGPGGELASLPGGGFGAGAGAGSAGPAVDRSLGLGGDGRAVRSSTAGVVVDPAAVAQLGAAGVGPTTTAPVVAPRFTG